MIATIIDLARSIHVDVIAEGIETHEQAETLRRLDSLPAQGFLYAPPVAASAVSALRDRTLPGVALITA